MSGFQKSGTGSALNFIDAEELADQRKAARLEPQEPLLLIKIERNWSLLLERYGHVAAIPASEIYEATRTSWRIDVNRAAKAAFVLPVARGLVRGAYVATKWDDAPGGRKQFVGNDVSQSTGQHLIKKSVSHLFARGAQTPIRYVEPGKIPPP